MKWVLSVCSAGLFLSLLVNAVWAEYEWRPLAPPGRFLAQFACPPIQPGCPTPGIPGSPTMPNTGQPGDQQPQQPGQDAVSQSPEAGFDVANTFDPNVFGNLIGPVGQSIVLQHGVTSSVKPGQVLLSGNRIAVVAPVPFRGTFKITENESPRPADRVFFNYNYFDSVSPAFGAGATNGNLNRETFGFEKTLLDGNASVGMRLPVFELTGAASLDETEVGDLSMIFKYAFINDRETKDVLSTGMVLTVPTGQGVAVAGESDLRSTLFEPFIGYIYHINKDLYVQGFSSISVPTDLRDVTLLFNSVAVGYYLYRDPDKSASLVSVVPDLEFHLNDPLNHRGLESAGPIGYPDTLDTTVGCYFIFHRAVAGIAVCVPLTGPKPYEVEGTASLNFIF